MEPPTNESLCFPRGEKRQLYLVALLAVFGIASVLRTATENSVLGSSANSALTSKKSDVPACSSAGSPSDEMPQVKVEVVGTSPSIHQVGWWTPWVQETATVFKPWNGTAYDWCHPFSTPKSDIPPSDKTVVGLLFAKSHKAASSTCRGINHAIAHHVGRRLHRNVTPGHRICEHYDEHRLHNGKRYLSKRDKSRSLSWAFVRHPKSRDMSQLYHFRVSRQGLDPVNDVENALKYLKASKSKQTFYLAMEHLKRVIGSDFWNPTRSPPDSDALQHVSETIVSKILDHYNFIGVAERMSESLAVMTLLWQLDPRDVIVLSAKTTTGNGTNYDDGKYRGKCFALTTPPKDAHMPAPMAAYYNSTESVIGHWDYLLYYAVQESLDRTIQELGVERVQERARLIKDLQRVADEQCLDSAIFPCSKEGKLQIKASARSCYQGDSGCGHRCVDQVLKEYFVQNVVG